MEAVTARAMAGAAKGMEAVAAWVAKVAAAGIAALRAAVAAAAAGWAADEAREDWAAAVMAAAAACDGGGGGGDGRGIGGECAMAACSCPIISLKLRAVLMPRIATSRTTLTSSSVLDQRRVGCSLSFFFFRFGVQAFSTSSGASLSKPRGIFRAPSVRSPRRRASTISRAIAAQHMMHAAELRAPPRL